MKNRRRIEDGECANSPTPKDMKMDENARIILQSDWEQSLNSANGTAWVSLRRPGSSSIHGELVASGSGGGSFTASAGFTARRLTQRQLQVTHSGESTCRCVFLAPTITYSSVHKLHKRIYCVDVTTGGLAVSSDSEGRTYVWTTSNGEIRRELTGHYGDVYTCRFYPSGVVVLTGGADMQLKIWSAETGQCATTLRGHKAGILSTAIVERGRNVLSSSRDGSVKLWDCGTQKCLASWEDNGGIVNDCACQPVRAGLLDLGQPEHPPSESECLTEGKLLLAACENGSLLGYGLHSRHKVFGVTCSGAVNCCTFINDMQAACGTEEGQLYLWDLRNTSEPLLHQKDTRGAIHSLLPYQQGCFATAADGSCFLLNELHQTSLDLTGPDCDPVYKVCGAGRDVFTCCRDGLIRRYSPS